MNIKAFGKNQFYFWFFTNFETSFFVFILGPIMHNLTKFHGFKFVFWSSRIQNKQPLFTVYPLYTFICNGSWLWQGHLIMRSLLRSVNLLIILIQCVIDNKQSVHLSFYWMNILTVKIL
jgi:hypothetical protein